MTPSQARKMLRLGPRAGQEEIRRAFLALARQHHPDNGGDHLAMTDINNAYDVLSGDPGPTVRAMAGARVTRVDRDVASFTVDALPVVAFENLVLVAGILGDVADDDPPYLLEFVIRDTGQLWVRCDLVPDAGSTTVSVTTLNMDGIPGFSVEQVRDVLVHELNSLETDDDV